MWTAITVMLGLFVSAIALASELSMEQAPYEKVSPKPDVHITVSVKPDDIHWMDVQLPLWREAVNAGYQQLEDWLRERHQQTQQPVGTNDYLSRLPRELLQYIANKCGTTGKSLYVLSLVNTRLLFALLPRLRERHWQHEVGWLSRFRIRDELRDYQSPPHKVFKIRKRGACETYMHKGLYNLLANFSQQKCCYQQRSTLEDWDSQYACPTLRELRADGQAQTLSLQSKDLLVPFPPVNLHLVKTMDLDLWAFRVLAPHLMKSGVALESLSLHRLPYNHESQQNISLALGKLTTLKELVIRASFLTLPSTLHLLTQLEQLDIRQPSRGCLEKILPKLTNLKVLRLESVRHAPEILLECMAQLRNLTILTLPKIWIGTFPNNLCPLACLKELHLRDSTLRQLPETIGGLQSLQYLDVVGNQLKTLPSSLFTILSLANIQAHGNAFSSLPVESIWAHHKRRQKMGLPPLTLGIQRDDTLTLKGSPRDLLQKVTPLENLTILKFRKMKLKKFPEPLCYLSQLKELHLRGNKLQQLPEAMGGLQSLEYLDVVGNKLETLPSSLFTILSLADVQAHNNALSDLPVESICTHNKRRQKAGLPLLVLGIRMNDTLPLLVRWRLFWHEIT